MSEPKPKKTAERLSAKIGLNGLFGHGWVLRNIPFFLFLSSLAVVHIYFGHYSEKLSREIGRVEKKIKQMEYEHKTIKSDVIFRSKWSELVAAVAPLGLKELSQPPVYLVDSSAVK
jgi:hypothetical protein